MAEGDQAVATADPEVGGGAGAAAAAVVADPPAQPSTTAPDPGNVDTPFTELEIVSMERDDYRRKLEAVQAELAALTGASTDADTINKLQQDNDHLRKTLKKATDMLREKMTSCNVQEKKNAALNQQVTTLKEVLQVTRDLLSIRNMEVEQLQKNVDSMEARIDDNRKRQTAMIKQMEQATKINGQLRTEYETQLQIFQSLKERYEEKVTALTNLAYERQRHNSEGSEKFEDAPDTADGSESLNATGASTAPETSTTESSNATEASTASETNTAESSNASEASTATETNTVESSNATEASTAPETNTTESSNAIEASTAPETNNTSESSNMDKPTTNALEIAPPETLIASQENAPQTENDLKDSSNDTNTLQTNTTVSIPLQEAATDTNTLQEVAIGTNNLQDIPPPTSEAL